MHLGQTAGPDSRRPLLQFADGHKDGAISPDGLVRGTYVHGLFADDRQRAAQLDWFGAPPGALRYEAEVDRVLDSLALHLAADIDLDRLLSLAR